MRRGNAKADLSAVARFAAKRRWSAKADLSAVARFAAKRRWSAKADVAQLAERVLGKDEVTSSILVIGSSLACRGRLFPGGLRARQASRGLAEAHRAKAHAWRASCSRDGWRR